MAPTVGDFHALQPKYSSEDPDIRFMTLVDLSRLLQTTPVNTLAREVSLFTTTYNNLIRLLDDTNGDVQNQALKCIQPFTARAPPEILIPFMQQVVNLETSKSQDASITSTAARTLVMSLPHPTDGKPPSQQALEAFDAISKVLIPRILPSHPRSQSKGQGFINFDASKGVGIEALDLLAEVINAYGSMLTPIQLSTIQDCLIAVLNDDKTGAIAKKRAISSLAKLSTRFSDVAMSGFVSGVVEDLRQSHITAQKRRLYISVLGAMARSTRAKFGPYLQTVTPFVLSAVSQEELDDTIQAIAEDDYDLATDDLKEAALLTLEEFLNFCSVDMRPFTAEVVEAGLRYLSYNPANLAGDDGDDDMIDDIEDLEVDDEDEDYEQEEQFDDEDDASWKIRRAAGKVFYSLISTRPDLMDSGQIYDKILPALTKAFKDREDSVQLEALLAATLIVKKTADTVSVQPSSIPNGAKNTAEPQRTTRKRRRVDSTAGALTEEELSRGYASPDTGSTTPISAPQSDLLRQASSIIPASVTLLSSKSVTSRQASIGLLKAFVNVKHDSLATQLDKVLPPIVDTIISSQGALAAHSSLSGLNASGGSLRIEALQLLAVILDTHSSNSISSFIEKAIKAVISAGDDRNFRIAVEAIETSESIIKALTPPRSFGYDGKSKQYIEQMFDFVLSKAESSDTDLEIRKRAIQALGVCLTRTSQTSGNLSAVKRSEALSFLLGRLSGETTRTPATFAIDLFLSTEQSDELDRRWVTGIATELGNHLRKSDRRVRAAALVAIKKLTGNAKARDRLEKSNLETLTNLLIQLYTSEGLSNISLITDVLSDLVTISPQAVVTSSFNETICEIAVQTIAGHALDSFLELIANVGASGAGGPLMDDLLRKVGVHGEPAVVGATIGTLLASGGSSLKVDVNSFVSEARGKADDRRVALALIVLGEIGYILGTQSKITPEIFVESLKSKSEAVQAAAATSLGRAAAANTGSFLPVLFDVFQDKSTKTTNGLLSVKELLQQTSKSNSNLSTYSQQLWDRLLIIAREEETRSLAAECIGRLAATEPVKYFPLLQDHLSNTQPGVRGAIIQAVRFAVSDADDHGDDNLRPYLVKMLVVMLQDKNIDNKRLAMATLQATARNKSRLVLPHLPQLLPYVFDSSVKDMALVREVQMGPFKHKVDDGLEMRKAAYETLRAFIDVAYSRVSHLDLFDRVIAGLGDDHDVKILSFSMLNRLIDIDHDEVVRHIDSVAERFQAILATKLKENAVKQEVEKLNDTIKEVVYLSFRLKEGFPEVSSPSGTGSTGQTFRSLIEIIKKDFATQWHAASADIRRQ